MISVIVPVYNCENYLDNSIQSLVCQTIFDQLEIIFVNDGSTDNSEIIIQSYVDQYANMKLITQENCGVSVARNRGMKESRGEYICFFDADDYAKPSLYEKLYNLINMYNSDIAIVDYSMVFPDGTEKKHRENCNTILTDNKTMLIEYFTGHLICTNPVDKIFKAKIIKDITFPEGYAIGEDMYFVYRAIQKSTRIAIDTTDSLYQYIFRQNSAMKTTFTDKHLDAVRLSYEIFNSYDELDEMRLYAEINYMHEICKMLALYVKSGSPKIYLEKVKAYKVELNNYNLKRAKKHMDNKHFISFLLMKFSPKLYLIIYRILRIG